MRDRFSGSMLTSPLPAAAVSAVIRYRSTRISAQVLSAGGAENALGRIPICRAFGPTKPTRRYSARPDMRTRNFSRRLSAPNWTKSDRAARPRQAGGLDELDGSGAYNAEFSSVRRTGVRTSMIVDPANGRIPPLNPRAQKIAAADRDFRVALMQAGRNVARPNCRRAAGADTIPAHAPAHDLPARYNTARMKSP